jgi:hypothetical protein
MPNAYNQRDIWIGVYLSEGARYLESRNITSNPNQRLATDHIFPHNRATKTHIPGRRPSKKKKKTSNSSNNIVGLWPPGDQERCAAHAFTDLKPRKDTSSHENIPQQKVRQKN